MEQSKLFTELAQIYDLFYQKHLNYSKIAKFLDSFLKKHQAKKVLHVGSGPGRLSKILSQKYNYDVHTLDNSQEMLALSLKINPRLPQTLADMTDFHLREDFDTVVLAGSTFSHLIEDNDINSALEKFHDSLKIGGILIIDTFYPDKLIEGGSFTDKKTVKGRDYSVTRLAKTKVIQNDPTIAHTEFSFRVSKDGRTVFEKVEFLLRGIGQKDMKKFLKNNDFEVLEFTKGIDQASYFVIAKAD